MSTEIDNIETLTNILKPLAPYVLHLINDHGRKRVEAERSVKIVHNLSNDEMKVLAQLVSEIQNR